VGVGVFDRVGVGVGVGVGVADVAGTFEVTGALEDALETVGVPAGGPV
jgi:hypothetical protein